MPVYVSASSRLHALLTALGAQEHNRSLRYGWSQVLGVPEDDVQFGELGLPVVARLVSGSGDEAERAATEVGLPLRSALVSEWSKPVYAPGANLDGPIHQQAVSPEALAYLDSVASVLRTSEHHPAVPEGDEVADLLRQVSELSESVEVSTELPEDVRQALLRRIAQLRFAIENARIGGPEGVKQAVELLLGSAAVRAQFIPRPTVQKILVVAAVVFGVFTAGPEVQASLEAWPDIVQTLMPGTEGAPGAGEADGQ